MKPGKLLILSDYVGSALGAAAGGAGIAALASYRALEAAGMRVELVTGFGGEVVSGQRCLGGEDLRSGSRWRAAATVYHAAAGSAVEQVLRDEDPEATVVLLHQWTRYLSPAAVVALRAFPLMIYMHDYFWLCPNGVYFDLRRGEPCERVPGGMACLSTSCDRNGTAHKLARIARHKALRWAERGAEKARIFLHVSEAARAVAEPRLAGRHAVVRNPMLFHPKPTVGAVPTRHVGYIGRLESEKGVRALAEALVARGMRGLFVGEGALGDWLRGQPGIDVMPWQPREAIAALMRSCRAVALPSLWRETWGLVVAEAMGAGVPVLVSDRAGSAELVRRFGGGLVFDPGDAASFQAALAAVEADRLPGPLDDAMRRSLAAALSPDRHAAVIADLARETFHIDPLGCR